MGECLTVSMKTDLDHLPEKKQWELARIKDILFEEFDAAMANGTQEWRRMGQMQHIILFGSYARGDWVDEPHTTKGYKSDYDLLIIVSHKKIIEMTTLWDDLENRLLRDKAIETPVTFILETLQDVNDSLSKGQYFFTDIRKQGIALHAKPNKRLVEPKPLSEQEEYETAKEHFDVWIENAQVALKTAHFCIGEGHLNYAAFNFHQATENAYSAFLLTLTNYSPPTHRLKSLRGFAEGLDKRLIDVWPNDTKDHRAKFNKLAEAYVKARYSKHYTITEETIEWLSERIKHLHIQVNQICTDHLNKLEERTKAEK